MDWKILGVCAFVGGVAAGPLGVIVGAGIGSLLSFVLKATSPINEKDSLVMPWFAAFAGAASASGRSSPKAESRAKVIAQRIEGIGDAGNIERLFAQAKQAPYTAQECGEMFGAFDEDTRWVLAIDLLSILHADSPVLEDAKLDWIVKVTNTSGQSREFWTSLMAWFEPLEFTFDRNGALATLGLSAETTATQLKTQYHALCREYHPDRHVNVTPALKRLAEDKLKEINAAYDLLVGGGKPAASAFRVRAKDKTWRNASDISDGFVTYCFVCGQANRIGRKSVRASRCGTCHAQLAIHRDLADSTMR